MPYIDPNRYDSVEAGDVYSEGELNYAITMLAQRWMNRHGGLSYANINAVVGVLECAKQEFYRRLAAPYEDEKARLNGDVYGG